MAESAGPVVRVMTADAQGRVTLGMGFANHVVQVEYHDGGTVVVRKVKVKVAGERKRGRPAQKKVAVGK